ncbi:2324_t:CDS:1, partial [Dentiscutata heterogama]
MFANLFDHFPQLKTILISNTSDDSFSPDHFAPNETFLEIGLIIPKNIFLDELIESVEFNNFYCNYPKILIEYSNDEICEMLVRTCISIIDMQSQLLPELKQVIIKIQEKLTYKFYVSDDNNHTLKISLIYEKNHPDLGASTHLQIINITHDKKK